MKLTALVTGASGGIGRDLAYLHAKQGGDLVIVARSREGLEALQVELAEKYGTQVHVISSDLTAVDAIREIAEELRDLNIEVDVLINNAGFGGHGKFHKRSWDDDCAMIDLNVKALAELTHTFLQGMVNRNRGKILNVASTAGFLPGPMQATYYATKAFVVSFSQAIAEELADTDVTVTALCPGPVATGFAERAQLDGVEAFKKNVATSKSVAKVGYRAMERGDLIAINDWKLRLLLGWIVPLLPRSMVLRLSKQTMTKS